VSYLEIYNERLRDLLLPPAPPAPPGETVTDVMDGPLLDIREDKV
jgi:hypothetical protein